MKFSLDSIHKSSEFYQGHLWSVRFTESTPNILQSGGAINDVIPAQSVTEPIYNIEYETIPVGPGLNLPIPKAVNYLGELTVDFYDDGNKGRLLRVRNFFRDWSRSIHTDQGFVDIAKMVKTIEVRKYSRDSGGHVLQSKYDVLPPDKTDFQGQASAEFVVASITMNIVRVHQKNEK
jgi:hypothetical protein